jgi:hypothetical protein
MTVVDLTEDERQLLVTLATKHMVEIADDPALASVHLELQDIIKKLNREALALRANIYRHMAESAYVDPTLPPRECDNCHKIYRGPAVYCSLECALADA